MIYQFKTPTILLLSCIQYKIDVTQLDYLSKNFICEVGVY